MATVESTELNLCADGRTGMYKVIFTDASDTTIMENGTGLTITGDQAGAKTASIIEIPRVENRNSKAVVSGFFELDDGEWFEHGEVLTATASAGGLFSAEVGATESAAFTDQAVPNNRSAVGTDGEPKSNLRRTRFIRGSVPSSFTTAPTLTFDADEETGSDSATISITDQVSGLTTKFNNSDGGGNGFTYRKDYYGTGKHAIELVSGEGFRNTDTVDVSGGVTYHFVMEVDSDTDVMDRFGQFYDGGNGIVAVGNRELSVRISGGAASTPSRGDTNYGLVKNAVQLYSIVVYTNGDRVMYVDGRPYCSEASTVPTGTVTDKDWVRRHAGTGEIRLRRVDIIEDALTESEVYADQDYYANVIYADDPDLNGSLACFVSESGSSGGTGRYNDPVDAISPTTMRSADGSWLDRNNAGPHDVCVLVLAGEEVTIDGQITWRGGNADPMYPSHIGTYGTISSATPKAIIDYVDPNDGSGALTMFNSRNSSTGAVSGDETRVVSVELTSDNRNFRADGTATATDNLRPAVNLFESGTTQVGVGLVNVTVSSWNSLFSDNSSAALTGQTWSCNNLEIWRLAVRNTYEIGSTETSSGTGASICLFTSGRDGLFIKDVIGYEVGWDPDAIASTNAYNLWGGSIFDGTATNQGALDHQYGRFLYSSSSYGSVLCKNVALFRDASCGIQFREGGHFDDVLSWENSAPMYTVDQDSFVNNLIVDTMRESVGGNLIGFRGQAFSTYGSGASGVPRLTVIKNLLAINSDNTNPFPGVNFKSDRSSPSTTSPTGLANIRGENITVYGFDDGIQFQDNVDMIGYVQRSIIDLSESGTPTSVIDFDNNVSMTTFDITDIAYDLDSRDASLAWIYGSTGGTLATLRSSSGMGVTPVIDRTSAGMGYTKTTLADYATNTLGFTKADGGQTDAEELGEQWFEAFADAMRQGDDVSPYLPSRAAAVLFADWQVDSTTQALIEAEDTGETWGVLDAPTVANRTPADNASSVVDTLVPELVFSENMKVSDVSQVIELRRASDDSVLDSITAADATVNISDKTEVQLTGLSLSGVTGAVYIYLPSTAFEAIATGINYGGDMTSTDWNFSVGTLSGKGTSSSRLMASRLLFNKRPRSR